MFSFVFVFSTTDSRMGRERRARINSVTFPSEQDGIVASANLSPTFRSRPSGRPCCACTSSTSSTGHFPEVDVTTMIHTPKNPVIRYRKRLLTN